jgi:hypothetical protein
LHICHHVQDACQQHGDQSQHKEDGQLDVRVSTNVERPKEHPAAGDEGYAKGQAGC